MKRTALALTLILALFVSLMVGVQSANAQFPGNVYINPDGSITGTDKIQQVEGVYALTGDISGSIIVEKDNIVLDGAGYTLQGSGHATSQNGINESLGPQDQTAISLTLRTKVTIKNFAITNYDIPIALYKASYNTILKNSIINTYSYPGAIYLSNSTNNNIIQNDIEGSSQNAVTVVNSSNNLISENRISSSGTGIRIQGDDNVISGNVLEHNLDQILINLGSNNKVIGNNLTETGGMGIGLLHDTSGDTISKNNIYNSSQAIACYDEHNNIIFENSITDNNVGVEYATGISNNYNNTFYRNNFINNTKSFDIEFGHAGTGGSSSGELNDHWDNGTVGNYWSDYQTKYPNATEIDNSGIGNTPYIIDAYNIDHYPLMKPVAIPELPDGTGNNGTEKTEPFPTLLVVAVAITIVALVAIGVVVYWKKRKR
jgi:parallel beta-helix repeat protein